MSRPALVPLYLPITASAAAGFFEHARLPPLPVERAALFVAMAQLEQAQSHSHLQVLLRQAQQLFAQQPENGAQTLLQQRLQLADRAPEQIHRQLAGAAITYAPDELMHSQAWRGADGLYDLAFQQACRGSLQPFAIRLAAPSSEPEAEAEPLNARRRPRPQLATVGTRDQHVVASVISAGDGEHIQVQAYAGTGKTHLIHRMTAVLGTSFTYIAPSQGHLFGFQQATRASGNTVRALHLWGLAHELARLNAQRLQLSFIPRRISATYPPAEQARILGIPALGAHSPAQVLMICQRIIKRWCHTDSPLLSLREINRDTASLSGPMAANLLASCEHLWRQMFQRQAVHGHLLSVDIVHLAKWLMVTGAQIPAHFGTLIIDEAHDLQPAWQYLFSRYPGGCVQMGDPNQRLRGRLRPSHGAQQVWMGQSVRIGNGVEHLVNTALALGGNDPQAQGFAASRSHITARRSYSDPAGLPGEGLRVFGNPDALLDFLLQLTAAQAASVAVLPASARALRQQALGLIDLHRQQQARIAMQWQASAQQLQDAGYAALRQRIEDGFSLAALDALLAASADTDNAALLLGLVEHAKNLEADVVALTPCCFDRSVEQRHYHPARAAYQAMTRARHELWLPGDGMDRLRSTPMPEGY